LENFEKEANLPDFDPYAVKYYKKHLVETPELSSPFKRGPKIPHLFFVTMTEYSRSVHASAVAFPPYIVSNPLGECLANQGLKQLRMAESEKERFVTYYFNGQREVPFMNEDRVIIASPKVATYDLKPEMSAYGLTDVLIKNIKSRKYDFILVNFANPDMVAHTGVIPATISACECIDACLAKVIPEVLSMGGTAFVTADHGNAEELINPKTGGVDTEHSIFPVLFISVNKGLEGKNVSLNGGILADIAPTILKFLHLKIPQSMTGRNLLENVI
jgi:2,3-bisphosphoglycerate-independent phosphoglycerate mutase